MTTFEDFVRRQRNCLVPGDFVIAKAAAAAELCRVAVRGPDPAKQPVSIPDLVTNAVSGALSEKQGVVVMLSGGADSVFLTSVLRQRLEGTEVSAIVAKTRSNAVEVETALQLCAKHDTKVTLVEAAESDLQELLSEFVDRFGRLPRDVAQPLHNLLVRRALGVDDRVLVVDGQYADTLLFANPQNTYVTLWRLLVRNTGANRLLKMLGADASASLSPGTVALVDVARSLAIGDADLIAWLCRLEPSPSTKEVIGDLLQSYPLDLVFQSLFYTCLLEYREADKYLMCPEVLSPFRSTDLFVDAWRRPAFYNGWVRRKKPIWSYVRKNHPDLVAGVKRRSFEPQ